MNNLKKWSTLIANIAVLAGIIFLAVEINQNNTLMTASAYQDRSDDLLQMGAMVVEFGLLEFLRSNPIEDRHAHRSAKNGHAVLSNCSGQSTTELTPVGTYLPVTTQHTICRQ